MSSSPPWGSPPFSALPVAASCSAYAPYAAWLATQRAEPPFPVVATFFRAVLPSLNASNASVVEWHEWVRGSRRVISGDLSSVSDCRPELCRVLGVELDGDLSGVGVSLFPLQSGFVFPTPGVFSCFRCLKRGLGNWETAGDRRQETGTRRQETGTRNQEPRIRKLNTDKTYKMYKTGR